MGKMGSSKPTKNGGTKSSKGGMQQAITPDKAEMGVGRSGLPGSSKKMGGKC